MNKEKLREILISEINILKGISYQDLLHKVQNAETKESGEKEIFFQVEIQVFFDDPREKRNLRVMVSVDDGSFTRTVSPITDDFIISPEGNIL